MNDRLERAGERTTALLDEVERAIIGKRDVLELLLVGLLTRGHVLLEDLPGLAKTLMARSLATVLGLNFTRVQFTPDLLPGDLTGVSLYDPGSGSFDFRHGPIFANVVLGDEINRAPPKTQAALLEAMQEGQVSVDGVTRPIDAPFTVLATQNPVEFEGTYPLPEAQLDRFRLRVSVGYPGEDDEWEILRRRLERREDEIRLRTLLGREDVLELQDAVEDVHVDEDVGRYVVAVTRATRHAAGVDIGASPRGALSLMLAARGHALLRGRDFVTPDDVKSLAVPALAHRLVLRPDQWVRGTRPERIVEQVLDDVPVPASART